MNSSGKKSEIAAQLRFAMEYDVDTLCGLSEGLKIGNYKLHYFVECCPRRFVSGTYNEEAVIDDTCLFIPNYEYNHSSNRALYAKDTVYMKESYPYIDFIPAIVGLDSLYIYIDEEWNKKTLDSLIMSLSKSTFSGVVTIYRENSVSELYR